MKSMDKKNEHLNWSDRIYYTKTNIKRGQEVLFRWIANEWHLKCKVIVFMCGVQRLEDFSSSSSFFFLIRLFIV